MTIYIGTAVHNQWKTTENFLHSLDNPPQGRFKSILVDNGSTDETIELGPHKFDKYIRNEENLGCARAWNQIIDAVPEDDDFLVIINNDVIITDPNWLMILLETEIKSRLLIDPKNCPAIVTCGIDGISHDILKPIRSELFVIPKFECNIGGVVFAGFKKTFKHIKCFDSKYISPLFEDYEFWFMCHFREFKVVIAPTRLQHIGMVTLNSVGRDTDGAYRNKKDYLNKFSYRNSKRLRRILKDEGRL